MVGRDRRAVGGGEGLDGVLDGHVAGRLEDPADLDGGVIVAHEGEGLRRRGVLVGSRAEQGGDGDLEEIVVANPCLFRVG